MNKPISIVSLASISALGKEQDEIWSNYLEDKHHLSKKKFDHSEAWVAQLPEQVKLDLNELKNSDPKYKRLDNTVLFGIYVSRRAIQDADWNSEDNFGVNFGSSRGATQLFENYHEEFLNDYKASTLSSPTTTLGNISSWIAHDLQTKGPEVSHSITCSTALHSLLNGIAWIKSGMANKFLVGGTEASLTEFTIAQMKAMKIYASAKLSKSSNSKDSYPCKALDLEKTSNTMVIGEGAAAICIEEGNSDKALAKIIGLGYATEILEHNTSISAEADCFQRSMQMAIKDIDPNEIDAIVMHAPGTIKGDESEFHAIQRVFSDKTPFLTTNKWKIGHTFGASGLLSLELAVQMLQHQKAIRVPFAMKQNLPDALNKVLVNAVGFGGNAVSILISR